MSAAKSGGLAWFWVIVFVLLAYSCGVDDASRDHNGDQVEEVSTDVVVSAP